MYGSHCYEARKESTAMKKSRFLAAVFGFSLLSAIVFGFGGPAAHAQDFIAPTVFQAAGPDAASIQGTVNAYRAELGNPDNLNNPGPLPSGRREINWDGGGADTTTAPVTPFNVFLNSRGGQFTTRGIGLS